MGRVDAWIVNYKLANEHPLTGAGLRNPYKTEIAATVDQERAPRAKAAHSIYFEVLGGAGYVGLVLYLAVLATAFRQLGRIARAHQKTADARPWLKQFGADVQLSLMVFCFGGLSTSMEMWDGYLLIIAMTAAATRIARSSGAPERSVGTRKAPALLARSLVKYRLNPILEP